MDNEKDNLSRDAIVYTVGNYFVKGVAVISAPIFTRLFSTEDYGRVTLYTTWISFFGILICLELKGTIINAFLKYENDYKGYVKNCITISAISAIICELLILLFPIYTEKLFDMSARICMLGIIHAFFNGLTLFLSHYLTMTHRAVKYIIVSGVQAILNVLISVLFILYLPVDKFLGRIFGQFVASMMIGIYIIVYFCANTNRFLRWDYTRFGLPLALPLIFHALSGVILVGADKVMLGRLATDAEVGIYGFAGAVLSMLNALTVAFYTSWRSYVFEHLKKNNIEELRERMGSYIRCYTLLCVGFMLIQPELVKLLAERSYWDCIPVVVILIAGEYFFFLYTDSMSYELYHQKNIWTPIGSIGAAVINILINLVILRYMGAVGAAISTLLSNLVLWIFHDFISRRIVKGFYFPFRKYFVPVLAIVFMSVFSSITEERPYIRWTIAICLGIIFIRRLYKTKQLF